ncbi:MAG: hypothetical protein IIB53_02215 [Planctomycetes bacterium]|nr:hypothetical protein [Planctomycetota bacterium]
MTPITIGQDDGFGGIAPASVGGVMGVGGGIGGPVVVIIQAPSLRTAIDYSADSSERRRHCATCDLIVARANQITMNTGKTSSINATMTVTIAVPICSPWPPLGTGASKCKTSVITVAMIVQGIVNHDQSAQSLAPEA